MISRAQQHLESSFTLAEVLITLGIIGVVAAMTIPVLMNNIQDRQFKEAYKKAYSTASQAWLNAYTNGTIIPCANWGDWYGGTCNADNFNAFKKEFKVSKDCASNTSECWNMSGEKSWSGVYPTTDAFAFIDSSGIAWSKLRPDPGPEVLLDINGNNKPNKYGKDRFILELEYFNISAKSQNGNRDDVKYGFPVVFMYPDFPDNGTDFWAPLSSEQLYRCPSMNTNPCYYTSWITGGH